MAMSPSSPLAPPNAANQPNELLLVDASSDAANYAAMLRTSYRVATTSSFDVARQFLHRHSPAIVVANLDLPGNEGLEICRETKVMSNPAPVLVMTVQPERVPDALSVGCEAVLLKPFAPNLLFARIGRLLREHRRLLSERCASLRARAEFAQLKTSHLTARAELLRGGINRIWPNTSCPYCNHGGVTSFEFCSHRRSWYACLECKKVWIAKRQE